MEGSANYFTLSFVLGLALVAPYLFLCNKLGDSHRNRALGFGMVIAALIYVGFALWAGDQQWLQIELAGASIYCFLWCLALRYSSLWLAIGWGIHPLWDVALHWLGPGTHIVPAWYAIACVSFDLAVALHILRFSRAQSVS